MHASTERCYQRRACNKDAQTPLEILSDETDAVLHYILLAFCTDLKTKQYLIIAACDLLLLTFC